MRRKEENGRWNVRRDIYIGSFALQGPSITIPAAQITRVFRVFPTTPLRFLDSDSRRGARNARDERYRDDALIIPKDWCAFDVKLLQHGLPFVQGKLKAWIRKWIFFILHYNCTALSRIWVLTMSNVIAIYDTCKINLKDTWCSNEAERMLLIIYEKIYDIYKNLSTLLFN